MMSLGLPLLTPRDTQSLWYTPSHTFGYTVPPKPTSTPLLQSTQATPAAANQHSHHQQYRAQRDATRSALAAYGPSALQQLAIDEDAVEKRKLHIARFGATWIKPPGMMKTLQGVIDEELERAEQMAMEGETTVDEGAFGQDINMIGGEPVEIVGEGDGEEDDGEDGEDEDVEELEVGEEGLMEEGEVDLDADIPEADSTGWSEDEEEEEEEDEEEEDEEEEEEDEEVVEMDGEEEGEEEEEEEEEEEGGFEEHEGEGVSIYEEGESGLDELSAIADTTQGSIDEFSEIGDDSPRPIVAGHVQRRVDTPTSAARHVGPPGHYQNIRRLPARMQASGSSPLGRQITTPTSRTTRRGRAAPIADSSVMYMSGDEMEVDD
ncbi:hypothetical protein TWF970_002932 [Orbilia oligospora]|uniref:Uncharacterized protein n=1 Tax=Orbilia oligospora TaxID=2813651 RepID=A0A7C8V766_ORBOL|nr:hypothetical protein TWF970_002932 [Orbilia oligospora]